MSIIEVVSTTVKTKEYNSDFKYYFNVGFFYYLKSSDKVDKLLTIKSFIQVFLPSYKNKYVLEISDKHLTSKGKVDLRLF